MPCISDLRADLLSTFMQAYLARGTAHQHTKQTSYSYVPGTWYAYALTYSYIIIIIYDDLKYCLYSFICRQSTQATIPATEYNTQ